MLSYGKKIDFEASYLPVVSSGLKIKGAPGGCGGMIGALVADTANRIYALVPRTVFGPNPESSLVFLDKADGGRIGPACKPLGSAQRPRPLCDSIGLVPISLDTKVVATCDDLHQLDQPAAYVLDLLGKDTYAVRLSGIGRLGTICRMDSIIELQGPGGARGQVYGQTLEVRLAERNAVRRGDGGTIVLSAENAPVGMIVGATEDCAFLAPLAPLLIDKQLHFLTQREADAHNRAAAAAVAVGQGAGPGAVVLGDSKTSHARFADDGVLLGGIGLLEAA